MAMDAILTVLSTPKRKDFGSSSIWFRNKTSRDSVALMPN
jgi:hypothetical protein